MSVVRESTNTPGLRILGDCPVPVWGISSAERLRRQVRAAGVDATGGLHGSVLLVRSDYVYDQRIINKLTAARNTLLDATDGGASVPVAAHVDEAHLDAAERMLSGESLGAEEPPLQRVTAETLAGTYI